MDCNECTENLTAYLDGETPEPETLAIRSHLQNCAECSTDVESLSRVVSFVTYNQKILEPTPALWHNIETRLGIQQSAERFRTGKVANWFWPYRWATAAGLVLFMGIWGYVDYRGSEEALVRYMNQYVSDRERQEVGHTRETAGPLEKSNNPFMVVSHAPAFGNRYDGED